MRVLLLLPQEKLQLDPLEVTAGRVTVGFKSAVGGGGGARADKLKRREGWTTGGEPGP